MSDKGRQSFTDKAAAAVKPDSEKSTTEQMGDKMKGTADSLASTVQPKGQKSTGQQVGDTLSSDSGDDKSLMGKAKSAMGLGDDSGAK